MATSKPTHLRPYGSTRHMLWPPYTPPFAFLPLTLLLCIQGSIHIEATWDALSC